MRHVMRHGLAGVVAFGLLLSVTLVGQDARSAEAELRAAQYRAEVRGDWAGAIADYERLSKAADRDVAARALVALGDAYERTGTGDARAVFDRVVRTFSDRPDVAAVASRRLASLSASRTRELSQRRLWTTSEFITRDVSADGAWALGTKGRVDSQNRRHVDLLLRNTTSGAVSALVPSSDTGGPAPLGGRILANFSPDGQQVAYVWGERTDRVLPFDGRPSVRVVAAQPGAAPRTVFTADDGVDVIALGGWSPDGASVLCVLQAASGSTLGWLSIADGTLAAIRTFSAEEDPVVFSLSSDGQWIAYVRNAPGGSDTHIHLMRANGDEDSGAVLWTGTNTSPTWTPDGAHLLFSSNRSGTVALYGVRIGNGRTLGEPFVVRSTFSGVPIRIFPTGELYYADNGPRSNSVVLVAERTAGGASVVQAFRGDVPAISPDGRYVVLAAQDGLIVRSLDTGEERLYAHAGLGFGNSGQYLHNRWLPDSSGLIVWITENGDDHQGGSFYHLDRTTGAFSWLLPRITAGQVLSRAGAVSSDGKTFFVPARATDEGPYDRIVQIDLATGEVRSTATIAGDGLPGVFSVVVSPDDSTLALEVNIPGDRRLHLATVSTTGGTVRHVHSYQSTPMPDRIGWTPDGQLLFGALYGGVWRVMRVAATGGEPVPDGIDLSGLSGSVDIPALEPGVGNLGSVSADGSRLIIEAKSKLQYEVWALENVLAFLNARR